MKRWILAALIALIPLVCVVIYFYVVIQEAVCLQSGGIWSGLYQDCDLVIEEGFYALTISQIYAVMLAAIWLLLFLLISIALKHFKVLSK
jgi:hypothetical protein